MNDFNSAATETRGTTKSQLMNISAPQRNPLPDGVYNFQILQARRCRTRDGLPFANFDLVVLDGPERHERANVNCFAYLQTNDQPKPFGLGMLGTLAGTDLEVTRLCNMQFEGCLKSTFRESDLKSFTELLILHGLGDAPPRPLPGLAWNPPAGEYDFVMSPPENIRTGKRIAGQWVELQVTGSECEGYKIRKPIFNEGQTTAEDYLLSLGYRKRTKHQWELSVVSRLRVSYSEQWPRQDGWGAGELVLAC